MYTGEACSLGRTLEIVAHLRIPRAILSERLAPLVRSGVLAKAPRPGRRELYRLTDKGIDLFPVLRTLVAWGDRHGRSRRCSPG